MKTTRVWTLCGFLAVTLALVGCGDDTPENTETEEQQPETLTVAILSPGAGTFHRGIVEVSVDVTGAPSRVDLMVDEVQVQSLTEAPYTFQWDSSTAEEGTHQLCVEAINANDEATRSEVVAIDVDQTPPEVTFGGMDLPIVFSETESLTVNAVDNMGIAVVTVYVDDVELQTLTAPPFIVSWDTTNLPDGAVSLSTEVWDVAGHTASSEVVGVVVNGGTFGEILEDEVITWTIPENWRTVEYHERLHWAMPAGITSLMAVVQWDQPEWQLKLDVGTGTCPHSGVSRAMTDGVGGQLIIVIPASELDLDEFVEDQMWFLHIGEGPDMDLDEYLLASTEVAFLVALYSGE